jgi:PmbA/TldA metallopeptidase C-terminal domain
VPESELCYHDGIMGLDEPSALADLAAAVARSRIAGLVDVFLERRAEVWWRLARGRVVSREALLREGAAVRRNDTLASVDGLERPLLAGLLGLTTRALPPFSAPAFADPPRLEAAVPDLPDDWTAVRWSWRWSAVLFGRNAVLISTPELAEITFPDGHRALTVWPPAAPAEPSGERLQSPTHPRSGRPRVVLAPAAAAVLLHELVGHPLEGDVLRRGEPALPGRKGERLVDVRLSVHDDPTLDTLPGAFSADDEGEPGRARELLTDGVIVGALADRESAAILGVDAGNARRATVHARPRPRISNLVARAADALPHPPREEAAIEVATLSSGTIEPASGSILLQVRTAYALRKGVRTRPLTPFTLLGSVAGLRSGLLATAEPAVATAEPGWCAKDGEVVPTGAVAPWLLLSGVEVR